MPYRRRALCALATVTIASALPIVAGPAWSASDTSAAGALPIYSLSGVTTVVPSGSSDYLVSPVTRFTDTGPVRDVLRSADGAVVASLPALSRTLLASRATVVGHQVVSVVPNASETTIKVDDLASGTHTEWAMPNGYGNIYANPDWAVTVEQVGWRPVLVLHRPDGTSSVVAGPFEDCDYINLLDRDDSAVLFHPSCAGKPSLLDTTTGVVTLATGGNLTPHRTFLIGAPQNGSTPVSWATRADPATAHTQSVAAPEGTRFLTWGDGLMARVPQPCSTRPCGDDLVEVDLDSGNLGAVRASQVVAARSAADGSLLLTVDDGDHGALTVLQPGSTATTVASLPPAPAMPTSLGLSGERVVAAWNDGHAAPVTEFGNGSWPAVSDPVTHDALTQAPHVAGGTQTAGRASAIQVTSTGSSSESWRLVWPGGARTIDGARDVTLGRGGELARVSLGTALDPVSQVQELITGEVLWTGNVPAARVSIDGTWLWLVSDQRTLRGFDTMHPEAVRTIKLAEDCVNHGLEVRGRWALLECDGYFGSKFRVVDLTGAQPTAWLAEGYPWRLGNDYAFQFASTSTSDKVLTAVDFSASFTPHTLGPALPVAAPDDAGSHTLLWADTHGRVRRTSLDWVRVPPADPDATTPTLTGLGGSPRYLAAEDGRRTVSARWSYVDPQGTDEVRPSGVATYAVRWRTRPVSADWSPWTVARNLSTSQFSRTVRAESAICFQVRARDHAGNLSGWSRSKCTTVDGRPPVIDFATVDSNDQDQLVVRFTASDTVGVKHYSVRYRVGPDSAPWTLPQRWRDLDHGPVRLYKDDHGRRTCFRVTAFDRVGHSDSIVRCAR